MTDGWAPATLAAQAMGRIEPGTARPDPNEMTDFNVLTMNAKVFPAIPPMVCKRGERVRIRLGNLSAMDHHPIHLHGHYFKVVATDGGDIPAAGQWPESAILVPVGSTRDIDAPEFAAGFQSRLETQLQSGGIRCEGVHRAKDGRRIHVDINTSAIQLDGKPAVLAIRVTVEECFFHCSKAFIRSNLWKPDSWPERRKISFGAMLAKRIAADDPNLPQVIDDAVEEDYRTNL